MTRELILSKDIGLAYEEASVDSAADTLRSLIEMKAPSAKQTKSCRKTYGDMFDGEKIYSDMEAHLTQLSERGR